MTDSGPVTTAGVIAVGNLEARIDGQVSRATGGRLTVDERVELVELIALRGHVLGRMPTPSGPRRWRTSSSAGCRATPGRSWRAPG